MPKPLSSAKRDKRKGIPKNTSKDTRKEKLKAYAKKCIKDALSESGTLKSVDDIQRILQDHVEKYALPEDHFECLKSEDLCNLCMEVMNSQNQRPIQADIAPPTPNTNIQYGQTTPNSSRVGSEYDDQSEGHGEQESHGDATQDDDLPIVPVEGAEGEKFDIIFYHSTRAGFELVTAARCTNKRSYMSTTVAKRHNLRPDRTRDQSIRLTWRELDPTKEKPKSQSTRFWLIDDKSILNDIAIGTECDKLDEPEEQCERGDDAEDHHVEDDASESEDDDAEDDNSEEGSSDEEQVDDGEEDGEAEVDQSSEDSYVQVAMTKRTRQLSLVSATDMRRPKKAPRPEGYRYVANVLLSMIEVGNEAEVGTEPVAVLKAKKVGKAKKANPEPAEAKSSVKQTGASKSKKAVLLPELEISMTKKKRTPKETESPLKQKDGTKPSRPTKAAGAVKQSASRRNKGDG